MTPHNERAALRREIDRAADRYNAACGSSVTLTPRAARALAELRTLRARASDLDRQAAQRLALSKAPIDDVLAVIAVPLLADVMNDIVASVDDVLRRRGCAETVFGLYTADIRRAALAMVDTLDRAEESLPRLLDVDDTLVAAIRKKLMSFLRQRLNITDHGNPG